MRYINTIIIHCTATKAHKDVSIDTIRQWHLKRGFSDIGYHYVIGLDGTLFDGRPLEKMGAHCTGHNYGSIGIAYVGGLNKEGKPRDTRTDDQITTMTKLINELKDIFNIKEIGGHRDFSPDINKDGKIDQWEWVKICPSFEVKREYKP